MQSMSMKQTAIAIALASLALAGCGDGGAKPEASATSESGVSTTGSAEVSQERELAKSREKTVTQEVELFTLIVESVQSFRPRHIETNQTNVFLDDLICKMGKDMSQGAFMAGALADNGIDVENMTRDHPAYPLARGTQAEANAACVAGMWKETLQPMVGWPRPSQGGPFSAKGQAELREWAADRLGLVLGASGTMSAVAAELATMAGSTIPELEEKARQLLVENAESYRQAIDNKRAEAKPYAGQITLNFTGQQAAPIHFTVDGFDYQHGPSGALLSASGSPIFGGGYVGRVKYSVAAVAGSSATMAKRSGGSMSEEVSSGTTSSQGASIR